MKIESISVRNLKAISEMDANFGGCTAIITGSNNKGKSSFLTAIADRIRGLSPEHILKENESEGKAEMILTSGDKFIWEFDDEKKDKLTFISRDGLKTRSTKEINERFFKPVFDIDKFLNSSPKEQSKMLQAIAGIDLTDILAEYKAAYDHRTGCNAVYKQASAAVTSLGTVDPVETVDTESIKAKIKEEEAILTSLAEEARQKNEEAMQKWEAENKVHLTRLASENTLRQNQREKRDQAQELSHKLFLLGYESEDLTKWIESLPYLDPLPIEPLESPSFGLLMQDRTKIEELQAQLDSAEQTNTKAAEYLKYLSAVQAVDAAALKAKEADTKVKEVEARKQQMLQEAKFPDGIELTEEGITVEGLPLDKKQISTSKLYCAALKIASMQLGVVRSLHFDASPLDRNTLNDIQKWAENNDLQLLIERPSFEEQEIQYEIIHSHE